MKFKFFLFTLPIALLVLSSCGDDVPENTPESRTKKAGVVEKGCKLEAMAFESGENSRVLRFSYKEGILSNVETIENGVDLNQSMVFNYQDHGGIQTFISGAVISSYIYDDANRVLKIKGEKGGSTRTFDYNDQNQIVKQITSLNDVVYVTHEYEYNNLGQPAKVSVYDNVGDLVEINLIKYDDKINPLRNTGIELNNMEKIFGLPVGDQEHNVIEVNKIYKKNTTYKVNGEFKKEGDIEINQIDYKYDAKGYPIELVRLRNGRRMVMHLKYLCD